MKKLFVIVSLIIAFSASFTAKAEECQDIKFYQDLAESLGIVEIYDSADLTGDILENRNGKIIIEMVIGEVLDDEYNGRVLNPANPDFDYISYSSVEGIYAGDIILTYFIYNPDNNYVDDIMLRFDYVLDIGFEHFKADEAD